MDVKGFGRPLKDTNRPSREDRAGRQKSGLALPLGVLAGPDARADGGQSN